MWMREAVDVLLVVFVTVAAAFVSRMTNKPNGGRAAGGPSDQASPARWSGGQDQEEKHRRRVRRSPRSGATNERLVDDSCTGPLGRGTEAEPVEAGAD